MRSFSGLALALILIPGAAFSDQGSGPPQNQTKLADLPQKSFTLEGIVDDAEATPFACHFGRYVIKIKEKRNDRLAVTLSGSGILLNSKWLHTKVGANPEISYLLPANVQLTDGSVISAFCNDGGKPGETNIVYFVPARSAKAPARAPK